MTGPAAAVEETPVLVGLYMTLEAVLAWLLERAVLLIWIYTVGAILIALGNILTYDKYFIHIHWGGPFFRLEGHIHQWLVEQVLIQEYAIGWWWHQTSRLQAWIAHETWGWAKDVYHFGGWMVHTYVPTYVHGVADVIGHRAKTAGQVATSAAHVATRTAKVTYPRMGELNWIHRHWKALTKAVAAAGAIAAFPPSAIPKIWRGIDDLRKWRVHVNRRLTRLEALFGVAAMAIAMSNVIGVPWRCLRPRGPIGRVAKHLCGLPARAIEDLLGLLVDLFLLSIICQAIVLIEDGFSFIEPEITAFITAVETMACYGNDEHLPPGLPVFLSLPPVTGLVLPQAA